MMATFSPYNSGDYERQKSAVEYDYGNQVATNAYGRFLGQQRGSRQLGDMSQAFGRSYPKYRAQFGQRGVAGPGVRSGVQHQAMTNYLGDYAQQYGRAQQDITAEQQQFEQNEQRLGAFRQQSLTDIEAQKAQQIANDAQALEYLRNLVGGI
jgi:hypothetical protein